MKIVTAASFIILLSPLVLVVVLSITPQRLFTSACLAGDPTFSSQVEEDINKLPRPINLPMGVSMDDYRNNRNVGSGTYSKIRIVTSVIDLDDSSRYCTAAGDTRPNFLGATATCESSHVLSSDKRQRLLNLLNESVETMTDALSVDTLGANLKVGSTAQCSGGFSIPLSHVNTGVPNADFVLYVSAGPTASSVLAFAGACQRADDRYASRLIVGKINVNPSFLDAANERTMKVTLLHELMHALGFIKARFDAANILQRISFRGRAKNAIVSPRALMTARNFFDCSDLSGIELEDEAGTGTVDNHLDGRVYKDDLMAGIDFRLLSTIDLAIFEDLGVYRANYSAARPISFGKNMGCGFLRESCSTTAGGLGKYWCDSTTAAKGCASDIRGYGDCHTAPEVTDGCNFYLLSTKCFDLPSGKLNNSDNGESYGEESRCFMTNGTFKAQGSSASVTANTPRCFNVRCSATNGSLLFRVGNDTTWHECASGSQQISVSGFGGFVKCPPTLVDYCRTLNTTGDTQDVPVVTGWTIFPKTSADRAGSVQWVVVVVVILSSIVLSFL